MKEAGDYRPGKCLVFPESVIVNTTFNARIDMLGSYLLMLLVSGLKDTEIWASN